MRTNSMYSSAVLNSPSLSSASRWDLVYELLGDVHSGFSGQGLDLLMEFALLAPSCYRRYRSYFDYFLL